MEQNKFIQFLKKIGDERAAELFDVTPRAAMSWRLNDRTPRPAKAKQIVERTNGKIKLTDIYG